MFLFLFRKKKKERVIESKRYVCREEVYVCREAASRSVCIVRVICVSVRQCQFIFLSIIFFTQQRIF